MQKIYFLHFTFIFLFIGFISASAQELASVDLPVPSDSEGMKAIAERSPFDRATIYYGQLPPNYNGQVLVFNHGLTAVNDYWFQEDGGEMYVRAYEAGYLTAFVATTRSDGMWVDGEILSRALEQITLKFQVPQVDIIGWSNGGRAAEVAMIWHEKGSLVRNVYALGTPFWGTTFWDILSIPNGLFSGISGFLNISIFPDGYKDWGSGKGPFLSTRFYNKWVARPKLDNHPLNEENKHKFLSIAATNPCRFEDKIDFPPPAGLMNVAICTMGVLTTVVDFFTTFQPPVNSLNDGITSYGSALRPGGNRLTGPWDLRVNHFDIARAKFSWNIIENSLSTISKTDSASRSGRYYRYAKSSEEKAESYDTDGLEVLATSDYQIIDSENGYDNLVFEKGNPHPMEITFIQNNWATVDTTKLVVDSTAAGEKIYIPANARLMLSSTRLSTSTANAYKKQDFPEKYMAIAKQESKILAVLKNDPSHNRYLLKLENIAFSKDIKVTGVATLYADIEGDIVNKNTAVPVQLEYNSSLDAFVFERDSFKPAIYNLFLTIEEPNAFRRNMSYGFIGTELPEDISSKNITKNLQIVPNPAEKLAVLMIENDNNILVKEFELYSMTGKLMKKGKLSRNYQGTYSMDSLLYGLMKGLYVMLVKDAEFQNSLLLLKK